MCRWTKLSIALQSFVQKMISCTELVQTKLWGPSLCWYAQLTATTISWSCETLLLMRVIVEATLTSFPTHSIYIDETRDVLKCFIVVRFKRVCSSLLSNETLRNIIIAFGNIYTSNILELQYSNCKLKSFSFNNSVYYTFRERMFIN